MNDADPITGLYIPAELPSRSGAAWAPGLPARHGTEFVYPGRRVLLAPGTTWAYSPESCPVSSQFGVRLACAPEVLVCVDCGLDCS